MNYRDYITIEPNKCGGKPCVRGLGITVYPYNRLFRGIMRKLFYDCTIGKYYTKKILIISLFGVIYRKFLYNQ
ncbi:MAG: DUF433 domain-containing protein, partial [Dolichospermum sp.]